MEHPIVHSRAANALAIGPRGRSLWVGGRVTLTAAALRFAPNALNRMFHAPIGGTGSVDIPLSEIRTISVGNEMVTRVITIEHSQGAMQLRCFDAVGLARLIRDAAIVRDHDAP